MFGICLLIFIGLCIYHASESDNLTMENSDELDWMCLTVDSAMQSVEEVAQAMAR